ncbi:MAG: hypothetical protein ACOWW1_03170 [archaeon]|nr:hypothetical protein [Candidatus Bathyarchaeum sp.]
MFASDCLFQAKIVYLILSKDAQEALKLLSSHYDVVEPKLTVGMPKGYSKNPACYVGNTRTIHVARREVLYSPHIILHEFYHHLRRVTNAQGGIEKYADRFAQTYIQSYKQTTKQNMTK